MNIQVQKLRKSYKDREVLKNISFEIKRVHDVKKNNSDMDTYYVTGIPVIYKK